MLFEIDESVSELLSSEVGELDRQAIQRLAVAAMEGNHRLTGRRKVLQRLAETPGIAPRESAALIRAASKVAEDGQLPRKLKVFGRVVSSTDENPTAHIIGRQRIITFPLRWFDNTAKIQPVILLGENLSDVSVYQMVGEVGTVLARYGYLILSVSRQQGGGSTIGQVLGDVAAASAICICIVDSDKVCALGTEGGTALSVARFRDCATFPLIDVLLTHGRDLENALPNSFYRSSYGAGSRHEQMTDVLIELSIRGEHELRRHIDVKKGLVLRDLLGYMPGSPEEAFWSNRLPTLLAIRGINATMLPCTSSGVCGALRRSDCTCRVVNGNTDDILKTFADAYRGYDRFALARQLDDSVSGEWESLGSAIASWCCGDSRLRN